MAMSTQQNLLDKPPVWYPAAVLGGMLGAVLLLTMWTKKDENKA